MLPHLLNSEAGPEEFSHISTNTSQQSHSSQIIEADPEEFPHILRMRFDKALHQHILFYKTVVAVKINKLYIICGIINK